MARVFVGFGGDGAELIAGGEPFDDLAGRLDLFDRNRAQAS